MASIAIKLKNVSKRFRIYRSGKQRFLSLFSAGYRRNLETTTALDKISFKIEPGEVVNIVGAGGSGKSTVLEIISGVITPNKGELIVNGKVLSNLDSTLGYNNNYTGLKNLKVKGALLGMSKQAIKDTVGKAAEFSELGNLLNQPTITYTKEQKSRLAPSFALSLKPEILLIDKSLVGGDADFKRKCQNYLKQILGDPEVTALFASTTVADPSEYCNRAIILDKGKLVFDGNLDDAAEFQKELKAKAKASQ